MFFERPVGADGPSGSTAVPHFAFLIQPSANRVYAQAGAALGLAELKILAGALSGLSEVEGKVLGGLPYCAFRSEGESSCWLRPLGFHSSIYALFASEGQALIPVELPPVHAFADDLVTIPKYVGKTNEQFTRLMVNAAWSASQFFLAEEPLTLFDPVCGRGTSLNVALTYGFQVLGIDADGKAVQAWGQFLRQYAQKKRLKLKLQHRPIRKDKRLVADVYEGQMTPAESTAGAGTALAIKVVSDDSRKALQHLGKASAHILVGDLPYGVQHGSRKDGGGRSRGPADLIAESLPGWVAVLKEGGGLALGWNTLVLPRQDLCQLLVDAGLDVCSEGPYLELAHRVDNSIHRDVVVARKPPR